MSILLIFSTLPYLPSNTCFFFSLLVVCQPSWLGKTVDIAVAYWTVTMDSTRAQLAYIQWKMAFSTTFISDSRLKNTVRWNLFFLLIISSGQGNTIIGSFNGCTKNFWNRSRLGIMSENSLRIALRTKPKWGINSSTLHPLLAGFIDRQISTRSRIWENRSLRSLLRGTK